MAQSHHLDGAGQAECTFPSAIFKCLGSLAQLLRTCCVSFLLGSDTSRGRNYLFFLQKKKLYANKVNCVSHSVCLKNVKAQAATCVAFNPRLRGARYDCELGCGIQVGEGGGVTERKVLGILGNKFRG